MLFGTSNKRELESLGTNFTESTSVGLNPSVAPSGIDQGLVDPVKMDLSRASSTPSAIADGGSYNLGNLSSSPIRRNNYSVNPRDPTDVFKFRITGTRSINLNLHKISARDDADLRLYLDSNRNGRLDRSDRLLTSSRSTSNRDDSINYRAGSGTYFAKVERYAPGSSGWVRYNFHLSATPTSGSSSQRASNLLPVETDIGTLNGTRAFTGWVGNTDTSDVFRFRLGSNRNVNLILKGLSKDADLRLIRDINNNRIIDSRDVLVSSIRGGSNNPEWISRSLGAGNYFAQVYQYSGNTSYNLRMFTISDRGIGNLLQNAARNHNVSRNEMIGMLRNTKDYRSISRTELSELRTIVAETRPFMRDYVHNLSNKIVNGDPANAWWTGGAATRTALGNLVAGSSATKMERLIGKWFLGRDLPTASSDTIYRRARGSLFQGGISYRDIDQGNVGDCYLLASLAGTAFRSTSRIRNMFINNRDGTYTVRFYKNGVADYVTVNRYLPVYRSGSNRNRFYYANRDSGRLYNDNANELWVALAEKAYAQINESRWIGQDNTNTYAGISGGTLAAISHITGLSNTGYVSPFNTSELVRAYNANRITYLSDGGHAYTLVGHNSSKGLFRVYNPWGRTETYTSAGMRAKFRRFGYSGSRV